MKDIITQAPEQVQEITNEIDLPETIKINLRSQRFELPRKKIYILPQNVLVDLSTEIINSDETESDGEDSSVVKVDFSPAIFEYVLKTLGDGEEMLTPVPLSNFKAPIPQDQDSDLHPTTSLETQDEWESDPLEDAPWLISKTTGIPDILEQRPSFIYLREDLDYFVLSPKHLEWQDIIAQKEAVGQKLGVSPENRLLFGGLRNADVVDSPEFHLMQMLVLAGVKPEQEWELRERRENTSKITSVQLVPIRLPDSEADEDAVQALQKLILFWRKPAKKCWWNQFDTTIGDERIRVHTRRVWTLELCILGVE